MNDMRSAGRTAVYIDTANCRNADLDHLAMVARRYGEIMSCQAYGNFAQPTLAQAAEKLFLLGVRLVHCPAWRSGSGLMKSTADETMMKDMQGTLYQQPCVTRFIICTGDGHYIPTIVELKQHGKAVVVMAVEQTTSRLLKTAADEFVALPPVAVKAPSNVMQTTVAAVRAVQQEQNRTLVAVANVKPKMRELLPGFDEKHYLDAHGRPYQSFSDFLADAERHGLVHTVRQGDQYLVTTLMGERHAA